ncbi:MAG: S1 RNA-binding domain-containing protein [Microcoleus sp. PH2017_29_MFU_D_A]|jgi:small subunit ribosomal protein S1|uniref:S1 RNA-binding domain-containing protein n=1 Tax=unclassified Microcoleus TaxID=2642155 RepID=UPI001DC7208A|nr:MULTISPECIES: S1 RNA-binding domain-containing protein [unclassified Microcoleus]MCC3417023.1 S1 RNA-binding domain-containing protein [Microcoleus sp. PH2017_07_MST_O_A]MCC3428866.1 S1 RNA-binding domain-containing protein [Microcoleus sp. PH2017_04_SCI_O_A]MCC3441620.1 S1 RNA-binding domain-containing protein [Microcoleus sp. PH2017_03_ELD_O_A]MCC3465171.1 S1 RNA-binding domain-containing protein [Microcoleus sp. PH2017_06_SFM_O_A]MCC3503233.1 S1 RNA-binding domain-containing protein [Mic
MNSKSTGSQSAKASFSMDDFAKALEQHNYEFQKGQVVRGKVFEYDSNGAYVDIGGKSSAFLPIEEAALRTVTDLSEVVPLDEEREFLIIREQDADGQVTLSLKQLQIQQAWEDLVALQETGKVLQVRVSGANKGGVTVDVEGMRGFIPRSHLAQRDNIESLIGQSLTVNFLEVDREREKLVLSQRMATQSSALNQLQIGQLVEGTVSSIKPFGVFVDLEGVSGLLHIKQVSQKYIENLGQVFTPGQPLKAVVVDLDQSRGRISLSTRVLENYPGEMVDKMADVMDTAEERSERARKTLS